MIARRGKLISVLVTVVAIALAGIIPTQEWVRVSAVDAESFSLTGAELNSALPALVLALGALALTLLFAGPRLSIVCGMALILLGGGVAWAALTAAGADNAVIEAEIATRTGLAGSQASAIETLDILPILTALGGVIAALGGVWVLFTSKHWNRQPNRDKYELRSGALAWDVLDEGEDPTADHETSTAELWQESKDPGHDNENA